MQPSVYGQSSTVHKRLPAGRALERPFPCVSPPMNHQIATAGEVLPTNLALVRPDTLMRSLDVGLQVLVIPVGPVADVTLEGPIRLRCRFWALTGRITATFFLPRYERCEADRRRRRHDGRERRKAHIGAGVDDRLLYWQLGFGLLLIGRFGIGFL